MQLALNRSSLPLQLQGSGFAALLRLQLDCSFCVRSRLTRSGSAALPRMQLARGSCDALPRVRLSALSRSSLPVQPQGSGFAAPLRLQLACATLLRLLLACAALLRSQLTFSSYTRLRTKERNRAPLLCS